jgi:hypothetical protein
MKKRILLVLILTLVVGCKNVLGQNLVTVKRGVVRIENAQGNETGAGFVVKIDAGNVYVVTAAHLVRGNQHPKIYLFSNQYEPLSSNVLDTEEDDTKGLAILLLKASQEATSGLSVLRFQPTSNLGNAEPVKVIGFPGGTSIWTVDAGNIKRLEGNSLVLSGDIREGYSGGPVILGDAVVGLITAKGQSGAYAARAEIVATYLEGIVKISRDPEKSLREALRDSLWLQHYVQIGDEAVYLQFEAGGRVRTRTPSNQTGTVYSNVKWEIRGDTLYVLQFDVNTDKVLWEESGTLTGERIQGNSKNIKTGSSSRWLLTKVSEVPKPSSVPR